MSKKLKVIYDFPLQILLYNFVIKVIVHQIM